VKLSAFGSFLVRDKGLRVGRNPKTGREVPIEPRRVIVASNTTATRHSLPAGKPISTGGDIASNGCVTSVG
jgi:integration host factor subunit alpha